MGLKPSTHNPTGVVQKHVNTAYDVVKIVSDNIAAVIFAGQNIDNINTVAADIESGTFDALIAAAVTTTANAATVATLYDIFQAQYLGPLATNPTVDGEGDPVIEGATYWNTVSNEFRIYDGAAWSAPATEAATSAATALAAQVAAGLSETNAAASETAAANSASGASTSEANALISRNDALGFAGNALASADNAATSETNAAASEAAAAASYDNFDDRYLGPKASDPTLDNDGQALLEGALYWNTVAKEMRVYDGAAWGASYIPAGAYAQLSADQTFTGEQTFANSVTLGAPAGGVQGAGTINAEGVYVGGVELTPDGGSLDGYVSAQLGWDISGLTVYSDLKGQRTSYDYSTQITTFAAGGFALDGTYFFAVGSNDIIHQYRCSPWDVTNTYYTGKTLDLSADLAGPRSILLGDNGTKLYVVSYTERAVHQYNLSTAGDISTGTYFTSFSVSASFNFSLSDIHFSSDGTTMVLAGSGTSMYLRTYTLSTAWDMSTASLSYSNTVSSSTGITFTSDGLKVIVSTTTSMFSYDLTVPYDVSQIPALSGLDLTRREYLINRWGGTIRGMWGNPDASVVHHFNGNPDLVAVHKPGIPGDVATAQWTTRSFSVAPQATFFEGRGFRISPDGTKVITGDRSGAQVWGWRLETPWDIHSMVYDNEQFTMTADTSMDAFHINPIGNKMYQVSTSDIVYEYDLSTPWDVTTAVYNSKSKSIVAEGNGPKGITFGDEGAYMYIAQNFDDTIDRYELTTPYDVSTAAYSTNFVNVLAYSEGPQDIAFNPDGTQLYIQSATKVTSYSLSTPWDLTTASYQRGGDLGAISGVTNIAFHPEGHTLWAFAANDLRIYEFPTRVAPTKSFRGAMVYSSVNVDLFHIQTESIPWDSELYDTDNIHVSGANNERLIVPSGVSKVRVSGGVRIYHATSLPNVDYIVFQIRKNNTNAADGEPFSVLGPTSYSYIRNTMTSAVLEVIPGDYFELILFQKNTDSNILELIAGAGSSWFAMEIIE